MGIFTFITPRELAAREGLSATQFIHSSHTPLGSPLYEVIPALWDVNQYLLGNHINYTVRNASLLFCRLGRKSVSEMPVFKVELICASYIVSDPISRLYYTLLEGQSIYRRFNESSLELDASGLPTLEVKKIEFFGGGSANYGHFLHDFLPNILCNRNRLVSYMYTNRSQEEMLDVFNVNTRFAFNFSDSFRIDVDELVVATGFPYCEIPRLFSSGRPLSEVVDGSRLALIRTNGNGSRIANIGQVVEVLRRFGFRIIDPTENSFVEVMQGVCKCSHLFISQDASSSNALFANKSAKVTFVVNEAFLYSNRFDLQLAFLPLTGVSNLSIVTGSQLGPGIPGWSKFVVPVEALVRQFADT